MGTLGFSGDDIRRVNGESGDRAANSSRDFVTLLRRAERSFTNLYFPLSVEYRGERDFLAVSTAGSHETIP